MGANSFFYEMTPNYIGGSNENDSVASPESVLIHFKGKGQTKEDTFDNDPSYRKCTKIQQYELAIYNGHFMSILNCKF